MAKSFISKNMENGLQLPLLLYGTAFKKGRTETLTQEALKLGFVGVDTANYPKYYEEPLVGLALATMFQAGTKRCDLFIQSKFTPAWAHPKDKIPFNPNQSVERQIRESIQQSFDHLKVDYLDSLLLHVPFQDEKDNLVAWKVFETFVPEKIRKLGVSNFSLPQLQRLYEVATIKPSFVQNRFVRESSYDIRLRSFCADRGISYQAYSMLKNNPEILDSSLLATIAAKLDVEKELAFYILVLGLGEICVLDGTTKSERMSKDLRAVSQFFSHGKLVTDLQPALAEFKHLLRELAPEEATTEEDKFGASERETSERI